MNEKYPSIKKDVWREIFLIYIKHKRIHYNLCEVDLIWLSMNGFVSYVF